MVTGIAPQTREKISIANKAIQYVAGKTSYTYTQIVQIIENVLTETLDNTVKDVEVWIDHYVPKRTGQLRYMLKQWLNGSNIYNHVLRIQIGTNLDYAEQVADMPTGRVRHYNQKGYVYYPNIFGIRGKVMLNDPSAVGFFWGKLLAYVRERLEIQFIKAKNKYLSTGRYSQLIRTRMKIE